MRRYISLSGLLAAFLFLILSGSQNASALTGTEKQVSHNGVSLTYDSSLATEVIGSTLPEKREDENSTPWWMAYPEHVMFEFKGFAAKGIFNHAIYIFPVKNDYKSLTLASSEDFWVRDVNKLRHLLSQKPDPISLAAERRNDIFAAGERMPYLPPINAVILPLGKEEYITFRNGSGIRYLFYGSQDVSPPQAGDTGYTFQGLTDDGKYYVVAIFPAAPAVGLTPASPGSTDFTQQIGEIMTNLEQVNNGDYLPNLNSLDDMIKSLKINSAAISLQGSPSSQNMPNAGSGFLLTLYSMALISILLALVIGVARLIFYREIRSKR